MSNETAYPHTNLDELARMKIPALGGKGSKNNRLILEHIALNGPLLPYDVFKDLGYDSNQYSTVNRRIRDLKKRGYLAVAGKRATERGKQKEESMYGLTWRGFIASLSIKEVRENIFRVLEENPLLDLPEREFILAVLDDVFDTKKVEKIAISLLHGILGSATSLEKIEEEQLKMVLPLLAMKEIFPLLKEDEKMKDLTKLLDNPKILQIVKRKIPSLKANLERQLHSLYYSLGMLEGINKVINSVEPGEKPSEKLKEFFRSVEK